MPEQIEIVDASDRSLLVRPGDAARVSALLRKLEADPPPGVVNLHPAYCSILVVFDPLVAERDELAREITRRARFAEHGPAATARVIEIPVVYDGPDIEDVAAHLGLTPAEVAAMHASPVYTVAFLGFLPGFAYLSGLPERLAVPRLAMPRPAVPAGSVAIAGTQTAVYPVVTPGGWRLIGRTSTRMFDPDRPGFALLRTGDSVRFVCE